MFTQIIRSENKLIQKKDPIYHVPHNYFGRAQYFAPVKQIGTIKIDTIYFNVLVLWLMIGTLYILLVDDSLKKLLQLFGGKRVKK